MSGAMDGMETSKAEPYSKVWNLPNILTYGRIMAVPIVAGLLLWSGNTARWTALAIYIVAAITDLGSVFARCTARAAASFVARSNR